MNAWPIEDIWLRPLVSLPLAAALPWALDRLAHTVGGPDSRTGPVLRPIEAALGWAIGATALGPALVESRHAWGALAFGALLSVVTLAVGGRVRKLERPRLLRAMAAAVLPIALGGLASLGWTLPWTVVLAGAIALAVGASDHRALMKTDRLSLGTGAGVGILALGALALPWVLTDIDLEGAPEAGTDASRWRLRVDPWDEAAMLGAAWASRKRGEPERAIAQAREAQRMGLDAASALELEAEVHATAGDCDTARATFDRALRARAAEAFDEDALLTAPLTLGGFRLPPALVTECGGLDQLPGIGDAASAAE